MAANPTPLKDHWKEQRLFLSRIIGAAVIVVMLTGVLIGRLVQLQVVEHERFHDLSLGNHIRIRSLAPTRGLILDRNGKTLAENVTTWQLVAVPELVDNPDAVLRELEALELLDPGNHEAMLESVKTSRTRWAPVLLANLSEVQAATFAVRGHLFKGIDIQAGLIRNYPLGKAFAHAVGYVGMPSTGDYEQFDRQNYVGTSQIGKTGIERYYEERLHGNVGFRQQVVDADGRPSNTTVPDLKTELPVPGEHVVLTLDARLQVAAFEALSERRGAAVAIDPRTGEVLTLVSMPAFDPNQFASGISQADYLALVRDPDEPFVNRALAKQYNPGSTVKPFYGLAGLHYETEYVNEDHICTGEYHLPGSSRPWGEGSTVLPHGEMNLHSAIVRSCNVYFYGLGVALEIDRMEQFMQRFGFGRRTGIDIAGEHPGVMPGRDWKREFRPLGDANWYLGETVNTAIGQGYIEVTPLQLAHAAAALATRGERFQPRLLAATRNAKTGEEENAASSPLEPIVDVDSVHWQAIADAMLGVTTELRGTARTAMDGIEYTVAAKTGTAQVVGIGQDERYDAEALDERHRDNGLFIAYAPAENPEIAIAVIVENQGGGGRMAAPVARRMLDVYFDSEEAVEYVAQRFVF